jgi:predicted N-acetyltransferase YhbS
VEIRAAQPADAAQVADLLGQLGYPSLPAQVVARLDNMAAESGQHVLVAELDGRIVGLTTLNIRHVISSDAPIARIASVVVAEDVRGQGIGGRLIDAVEHTARNAGCERIEVTSGAHRTRAHAFYVRRGYAEFPRRFIKSLGPPVASPRSSAE